MITKEEEKEFKKPKLYRFWNFLIYGSSIAIGVFLVYLYSAYVLRPKFLRKTECINIMEDGTHTTTMVFTGIFPVRELHIIQSYNGIRKELF